ncbi:hypothetical protein RFI_30417, partial [Reticulomyxa filosa]
FFFFFFFFFFYIYIYLLQNQKYSELLIAIEVEFANPLTMIYDEGSIGSAMFIIKQGKCAVFADNRFETVDEIRILGNGQYFGESGLLITYLPRMTSVLSLEWCEFAVLQRNSFQAILNVYPKEKAIFQSYTDQVLAKWQQIRQRQKRSKASVKTGTSCSFVQATDDSRMDSFLITTDKMKQEQEQKQKQEQGQEEEKLREIYISQRSKMDLFQFSPKCPSSLNEGLPQAQSDTSITDCNSKLQEKIETIEQKLQTIFRQLTN